MRYSFAIATTAAFAATAIAAPAPEADRPWGRPGRPDTAANVYVPETCTAVLTSTSTVYATATTTATSTIVVTATPVPERQCVTEADSLVIADVFRQLIQDYSKEMALSALTEDFVDYSSAVNTIMNKGAQYPKNLTGATFTGRAAFMAGQGSQPKIPFTTIKVFYGCDSVSVRWMTSRSASGQAREVAAVPVIGNAILHVVPAEQGNKYNFRVKDIYSEFNAAAWLVNLGVFKPNGTVDYFVSTNSTSDIKTTAPARRSINFDHFDASLRGAAI